MAMAYSICHQIKNKYICSYSYKNGERKEKWGGGTRGGEEGGEKGTREESLWDYLSDYLVFCLWLFF